MNSCILLLLSLLALVLSKTVKVAGGDYLIRENPKIASLPNGDIGMAWLSRSSLSDSFRIEAQILESNLDPISDVLILSVFDGGSDDEDSTTQVAIPKITAVDESFVVIWSTISGVSYAVINDGKIQKTRTVFVSTKDPITGVSVSSLEDGDGSAAIFWSQYGVIYAMRIHLSGTESPYKYVSDSINGYDLFEAAKYNETSYVIIKRDYYRLYARFVSTSDGSLSGIQGTAPYTYPIAMAAPIKGGDNSVVVVSITNSDEIRRQTYTDAVWGGNTKIAPSSSADGSDFGKVSSARVSDATDSDYVVSWDAKGTSQNYVVTRRFANDWTVYDDFVLSTKDDYSFYESPSTAIITAERSVVTVYENSTFASDLPSIYVRLDQPIQIRSNKACVFGDEETVLDMINNFDIFHWEIDKTKVVLTFKAIQGVEFKNGENPVTTATLEDISKGLITFKGVGTGTHSYNMSASDGETTTEDSEAEIFPCLTIHGVEVVAMEGTFNGLSDKMFYAESFDQSDAMLTFEVKDVEGGFFEAPGFPYLPMTRFSQQQTGSDSIHFRADCSGNKPTFKVKVSDGVRETDWSSDVKTKIIPAYETKEDEDNVELKFTTGHYSSYDLTVLFDNPYIRPENLDLSIKDTLPAGIFLKDGMLLGTPSSKFDDKIAIRSSTDCKTVEIKIALKVGSMTPTTSYITVGVVSGSLACILGFGFMLFKKPEKMKKFKNAFKRKDKSDEKRERLRENKESSENVV